MAILTIIFGLYLFIELFNHPYTGVFNALLVAANQFVILFFIAIAINTLHFI